MRQGTDEWRMARLGHVTCSRFADVLTQPRSKAAKEAGELSATAESYLYELVGEHLTGRPASDLETFAMKWGNAHEPAAREAYTWRIGAYVKQIGLAFHPSEELVAGSPDGLIGTDGIVEIKCPLTIQNHVRVVVNEKVPDEHVTQIQGLLWITGRQWCDFVSYHPHCRDDKYRISVVRLPRDDELIESMTKAVADFRDDLLYILESLGCVPIHARQDGDRSTTDTNFSASDI